jgi:hypothetical protein
MNSIFAGCGNGPGLYWSTHLLSRVSKCTARTVRVTFMVCPLQIMQTGLLRMPKCRASDMDMLFLRLSAPMRGLNESLTGCLPYAGFSGL